MKYNVVEELGKGVYRLKYLKPQKVLEGTHSPQTATTAMTNNPESDVSMIVGQQRKCNTLQNDELPTKRLVTNPGVWQVHLNLKLSDKAVTEEGQS